MCEEPCVLCLGQELRWIGRCLAFSLAGLLVITATAAADETALLPGFRRSAWFDEQVREAWLEGSARAVMFAPRRLDPDRPLGLIVFATPNGNTVEQTLGSTRGPDTDWHFDIQHVAAQVRRWREVYDAENVVLACVEPAGLSWPAWRRAHEDGPARIRRIVEALRLWLPQHASVTLAAHSGGGSFVFGLVDAAEQIPREIDRIILLDANYAYADDLRHGEKLWVWLREDDRHRLVVVAYDDREVMLDGKKVVGPTEGTFRATQWMRDRLSRETTFVESTNGSMHTARGLDGRIVLHVHQNPQNKILHTALVGEMNGLLEGLSIGRETKSWGAFGGPRAYANWIQAAAGIPARPADAPGARELVERVRDLSWQDREELLAREFLRGNVPDFLRQWQPITVTASDAAGRIRTATFRVLPDYLAVGSDADFVRWPTTPQFAQRIADAYGASLPTRKMVDDVARAATVRLEPIPLTTDREAVATFVQHQDLIEAQWGDRPRGALAAGLKKDVVITNRLGERPNRVAIYGWHRRDDTPIQPLTTVHVNWYVDYSHGVRLVQRIVEVDGRPRDIRHVLQDAEWSALLSDEGPLLHAAY
jgi:hypothetical protein